MRLSIANYSATSKRTRCCDSGYEEQQRSSGIRRKNAGVDDRSDIEFLRQYPSFFFPYYNEYMMGDVDRQLSPIMLSRKKDLILHEIAQERMRLKRLTGRLDEYWKEWDVLNECIVMLKEYDSPPGYKSVKSSWDSCSFFKDGKLRKGNMMVGNIVGEMVDFVTPSIDVERIIDKYVKAIAVVETWRTKERFIEAWVMDVFRGERSERANIRYIYLGWRMRNYIGIDNPVMEGESGGGMMHVSVQCDTHRLSMFWEHALITLKAMLIMDCLDSWAETRLSSSSIVRPFKFGWDDSED
jgi:hypothetical protein